MTLTQTLTLSTLLLAGPEPMEAPSEREESEESKERAVAPALVEADFEGARETLIQAEGRAFEDPERGAEALADALAALHDYPPELARSPEAHAQRATAQLTLARAHLIAGRSEDAAAAMDEAIRSARVSEDALAPERFGPHLVELHAQRVAAIEQEGSAAIEIECELSCQVYVNEAEVGTEVESLPLGSYRVWIEDLSGEQAPLVRELVLDTPDEVERVRYEKAEEPPPPPPPPPPHPRRKMQRWQAVTTIMAGVTVMTVGSVLMGVDGHPRWGSPMNPPNRTMALGAIGVGLGFIPTLAGTVVLSVDETEVAKARGRVAMVRWQLRF